MPGQISRYIAREFFPLFAVSLGFTLFVLSLVNFFQAVELLLQSVFGGLLVIRYWFLLLAYLLSHALALAVLVAVLVTFSRLAQDRELLVIRGSGIPLRRVIGPLLATGALLCLVNLALVGFVQPHGRYQARVFRYRARLNPRPTPLRPGAIITDFPGVTIFVPSSAGREVTIFHRDGDLVRRFSARRIRLVGRGNAVHLYLENGAIRVYDPAAPETHQVLTFKTYSFPLPGARADQPAPPPRTREMDSLTLARTAGHEARLEQKSRLAYGFAPLVLMLIGIPLGAAIHRTGWGVIAACAVVLGYHFVMTLCQFIGNRNPALAGLVFLPNLLIAAPALRSLRH